MPPVTTTSDSTSNSGHETHPTTIIPRIYGPVEGRHSRRWIDRTKVDSYELELKNYKVGSRLLIRRAVEDYASS